MASFSASVLRCYHPSEPCGGGWAPAKVRFSRSEDGPRTCLISVPSSLAISYNINAVTTFTLDSSVHSVGCGCVVTMLYQCQGIPGPPIFAEMDLKVNLDCLSLSLLLPSL